MTVLCFDPKIPLILYLLFLSFWGGVDFGAKYRLSDPSRLLTALAPGKCVYGSNLESICHVLSETWFT